MKNLTILGSTGSIGVSTLQIVEAFPDDYRIVALTAGNNVALLAEQVISFARAWLRWSVSKGPRSWPRASRGLMSKSFLVLKG